MCVSLSLSLCGCVCVRERERKKERECVQTHICAAVREAGTSHMCETETETHVCDRVPVKELFTCQVSFAKEPYVWWALAKKRPAFAKELSLYWF